MKKIYLVGIVFILLVGIALVLRFGVGPRPIGMIKPSFFDHPQEIGAVTYRRLYDPLGRQNLVAVGVSPDIPEHRAVVEGFLLTAAAEKRPIEVVFQEEQLPPIAVPPGTQVVTFRFNDREDVIAERIREFTSAGKRVLLYSANILTSHLVKGNTIHRFEQAWGQPVYSISMVGISVRRDHQVKLDPPCVGSERDGQGTASLGCAAMAKGRTLFRKKLDNSRLIALMDQHGVADFVLFVSIPPTRPGQG
ncbi:MAG: hypothetical protein NDI61_10625 [Bdellovibrionaceae bacterium]|nr:hypothetical protein [Pseudobdellovibrionaceae bacterium]